VTVAAVPSPATLGSAEQSKTYVLPGFAPALIFLFLFL